MGGWVRLGGYASAPSPLPYVSGSRRGAPGGRRGEIIASSCCVNLLPASLSPRPSSRQQVVGGRSCSYSSREPTLSTLVAITPFAPVALGEAPFALEWPHKRPLEDHRSVSSASLQRPSHLLQGGRSGVQTFINWLEGHQHSPQKDDKNMLGNIGNLLVKYM